MTPTLALWLLFTLGRTQEPWECPDKPGHICKVDCENPTADWEREACLGPQEPL